MNDLLPNFPLPFRPVPPFLSIQVTDFSQLFPFRDLTLCDLGLPELHTWSL